MGGYSRMRAEEARRRQQPKPEGLIIHDMKARPATDAPQPYVKVSINNRVVLVDKSTGRQLALLGEIRGNFLSRRFLPATKENGYLTPLDADMAAAIGDLDGKELSATFTERDLAAALEALLLPGDD